MQINRFRLRLWQFVIAVAFLAICLLLLRSSLNRPVCPKCLGSGTCPYCLGSDRSCARCNGMWICENCMGTGIP
jgi:hypothetical protein